MSETYAPNQSNYVIGRGVLRIALIDPTTGTRGAYFHYGNVEDLGIVPTSQVATLRSSLDATSGVLAEDEISKDFEVRWRNTEMNRKVLAQAIAGTEAYFTQSSATVTAETLTTSAELGGTYITAKRGVSAYTLKVGATPAVEGTDYELVDATAGAFHVLSTATVITAGSTVTIDYTAAAVAGTTQKIIQGGNRGTVKVSMWFKGAPVAGPTREARVWLASLKMADLLPLINGNDYARMQQSAKILNDAAGTYGGSSSDPYFRIYER
jgi:hypothetical protein